MNSRKLLSQFQAPPPGYGNVAFYWWMGEPVTRERLAFQLEQLKGKKISGLQINYSHCESGGLSYGLTDDHHPRVFTEEWWELVGWFMEEAGKQGISVSLSDYTLGPPGQGYYMDMILRERPDMCGSLLTREILTVAKGDVIPLPEDKDIIAAQLVSGGEEPLEIPGWPWTAERDGLAVLVREKVVPASLDPMHPDAGREMLRVAFQPFEERFPGQMGKGFNFFFSDELNLGIEGNLWNRIFREEFRARKGYDLLTVISGLFVDIGPRTEKIRLDYRDVMVSLEEENFFAPVYQWHEDRGMIYGCDHGGRGKDVLEFGDYFRTQKYNQGPGCDQPGLASDVVKNKVASSISHLYGRPRTWLEGFYGSGWGTTGGQLADAIFRNFAQGQNLLSLHALYYSTKGGYWEWAPPCNHFRMPYWACASHILDCSERLSWLLSRGRHVCDVAVVYPVAAMEADREEGKKAVDAAFALGEALYRSQIDFDFIDFESVTGGRVENGALLAGTERYRAVILPNMQAARYSMMERLAELSRGGGTVLSVGRLPSASDRAGRGDPLLEDLCRELASGLTASVEDAVERIRREPQPDIRCDTEEQIYFLHRRIESQDLYFLYGVEKGVECFFHATGTAILLDPWTGKAFRLAGTEERNGGTVLSMPLSREEPALILFTGEACSDLPVFESFHGQPEILTLPDCWECAYLPTLDNTWGDYRHPAFSGTIGPEIRKARLRQGGREWEETLGFGDYWRLLALNREIDHEEVAGLLLQAKGEVVEIRGEGVPVVPYGYSLRGGVKGDPGRQGYHGLKGRISNDFLVFGNRREQWTEYTYEDEGKVYYFQSSVFAEENETAYVVTGTLRPDQIWINGIPVGGDCRAVRLWKGFNSIVLKYARTGRTHFLLSRTEEPRWSSRRYPLSMDWYENGDLYPYHREECPDTCRFSFNSPPGMESMVFFAASPPRVFCEGDGLEAVETGNSLFGAKEYRVDYSSSGPAAFTIEIEPSGGLQTADLIPEPIRFVCGAGSIQLGDWSRLEGLHSYSGGIRYSASLNLREPHNYRARLRLGEVACACKLWVNGEPAGFRAAGPWDFDVSGFLLHGENKLEIDVYNTLSNHYTTIPTRYRGSLVSGLIGPVTLELFQKERR